MQLSFEVFQKLLNDVENPSDKVAVAVSGGADSLALSLCLMQWCAKTGRNLVGISIDHGLRKEAAHECAFVEKVFIDKGFDHVTLKWTGVKPTRSLQKNARNARYDLISKYCAGQGIRDVFLGHHLDDQAETVIMRLIRGSGVDGLSAMHKVQDLKGLRLIRPFLTLPKSTLIEYLNDYGQSWIEDPSNENMDFDRVKIRKAMKSFTELGLTAEKLSLTASNMQRTRSFLAHQEKNWLAREVMMHREGFVELRLKAIMDGEEELIFRVLRIIGQSVGGQLQAPRLVRLKNLNASLQQKQTTTFMGCRWVVEKDQILVCRESRNNLKPVPLALTWDNRLEIDITGHEEKGLTMRALGRDGWEQVLRIQPELKDKKLPFPVITSLFSVWQGESLLTVPHIDFTTSQGLDLGLERLNVRFNPQTKLFS